MTDESENPKKPEEFGETCKRAHEYFLPMFNDLVSRWPLAVVCHLLTGVLATVLTTSPKHMRVELLATTFKRINKIIEQVETLEKIQAAAAVEAPREPGKLDS